MSTRRYKLVLFTVTALSLFLTTTLALGQTEPRAAVTARDLSSSLEATVQGVSPAVVEIFATSRLPGKGIVPRNADLVTTQRASGSGVIVDSDGYVVTNAHVVAGAQQLRLEVPIQAAGHSILATGSRSVTGHVVGIDLETDLAVL